MATKGCDACQQTGFALRKDGSVDTSRNCPECQGQGYVEVPDEGNKKGK